MIFISYNHRDEQLVDMVARRLELEFGRNNIFYDKWSIQPGDSIIGKMNEGIEKFTVFFYFISPNSINSKMVTKEWQSALNKAINDGLKFVPVRIADCRPPAILTDSLYIDLYGAGLDNAVAQMKCVAQDNNTYKAFPDIDNLIAIYEIVSDKMVKIEIRATMYMENETKFGLLCNNDVEILEVKIKDSFISLNSGTLDAKRDGMPTKLRMKIIELLRPVTPYNAVKIIITSEERLEFVGVAQLLSSNEGKIIQMKEGRLMW